MYLNGLLTSMLNQLFTSIQISYVYATYFVLFYDIHSLFNISPTINNILMIPKPIYTITHAWS